MAKRVCSWWVEYLLVTPLRRLVHNPERLLAPFVTAGMTVLEVGPAMGFFTLPFACLVGPTGQVICVDVQDGML
jgi:ubiquinone/menaquinone biosynthesis C-methylase UbiE